MPFSSNERRKNLCRRSDKLTTFVKLIIIEKVLGAEGPGEIESYPAIPNGQNPKYKYSSIEDN